MASQLQVKMTRNIKNLFLFLCSWRSLPMWKGTLAYLLAYVLIFLRKFDDLSRYPLALTSMMIVVIAGMPGKSVGACIQAVALAITGVSLGCVGFLVLAKLRPWPVAQGFVFAFIVYMLALVKARGIRWFGFSLLCILNSFNGIYTSYLPGPPFKPRYLEAYYSAYLWGGAIVLGVNLLVFPVSSERELRETLVRSLEHVGTFAHLLAKGYTLEINEEERALRDHLNQTIRADFGFLSQKIEETTIEINYSRFSMKAYQSFVSRIRGLQQALITAHSCLAGLEEKDIDLFKERFLPSTLVAFNQMRRAVDLTIRDIGHELGCKPMVIPATQDTYNIYMSSIESQSPIGDQLALVSSRLAAEVDNASSTSSSTPIGSPRPKEGTQNRPDRPEVEYGIQRLRREFDAYAAAQHDMLQEAVVSGHLQGATDGELRVHQPRLSLRDVFGLDLGHRDADGDLAYPNAQVLPEPEGEKPAVEEESSTAGEDSPEGTRKTLDNHHSLVRVWGFLFALERFVSELEGLSSSVRPDGVRPRKMLHVHLFQALRRPHRKDPTEDKDAELTLAEALALLENRPYTPAKRHFWERLNYYADVIQGPMSIFAAKTAAATGVFGVLIYANASRNWFINYSLTSGMLTVVVALAPTLGQSMLTFVLQIAGSGFGYLWSLAVLEMFRDVGGYKFNPYGIACMIIPFALILEYLLYFFPKFFVVALLGLNGCGVVVVVEWIAVEYLHRTNFDSPAYRTGKGTVGDTNPRNMIDKGSLVVLAALTIALAIVAIFQLFILRNPARHTLREQVAKLTFETLSYVVLLQAFGRSVLSADPAYRPSVPALSRVDRELSHRELKLQSEIINIMPLMSFAATEPQFGRPFRKDIFISLVRSNQIILDRLREAKAALGTSQFEEFILTHFVSVLAPYRGRMTRVIKAQLYMTASSLQSKAPLPHDTPLRILEEGVQANFIHDILVLSSRFAKTEEGNRSIRSREFMRYVSYLLGWIAIIEPLHVMEDASKQLFGELELKLL